jgi:hypothetical protein
VSFKGFFLRQEYLFSYHEILCLSASGFLRKTREGGAILPWISLYPFRTKIPVMDERLLDVIIGLAAFLILIVLLAVLPMVMAGGAGYLAAIIVFILFLSGAGYLVNEKIR